MTVNILPYNLEKFGVYVTLVRGYTMRTGNASLAFWGQGMFIASLKSELVVTVVELAADHLWELQGSLSCLRSARPNEGRAEHEDELLVFLSLCLSCDLQELCFGTSLLR